MSKASSSDSLPRLRGPLLLLLVGLPASGKSTFATTLRELLPEATIISSDDIRNTEAVKVALLKALKSSGVVIFDRCNASNKERNMFCRELAAAMKPPPRIDLLCFTTPPERCLERALRRPDHPTLRPEDAPKVIGYFSRGFRKPTPKEAPYHAMWVVPPPSADPSLASSASHGGKKGTASTSKSKGPTAATASATDASAATSATSAKATIPDSVLQFDPPRWLAKVYAARCAGRPPPVLPDVAAWLIEPLRANAEEGGVDAAPSAPQGSPSSSIGEVAVRAIGLLHEQFADNADPRSFAARLGLWAPWMEADVSSGHRGGGSHHVGAGEDATGAEEDGAATGEEPPGDDG